MSEQQPSVEEQLADLWNKRKTSEVAEHLGMTAYDCVANYRGFTEFIERELSEPLYDLKIIDGQRVWVRRTNE